MSIIFFDIDGTVMDLDGTIPPSAVTAVRRLRQAGHHCVINTGRPRLAMDPQLMDMDFDGLVCSCGQYIQLDGEDHPPCGLRPGDQPENPGDRPPVPGGYVL